MDRIDKVASSDGEEITRIIDYKTGKVMMLPISKSGIDDPSEYLKPYFTDGKYKAGFQAYYYASLIDQLHPNTALKAGIFSTRSLSDGIKFLRKNAVIPPEILGMYRLKLKDLIEEIMDPNQSFNQTDDISKCRVCAYKSICRR